jgi:hypothetical protein
MIDLSKNIKYFYQGTTIYMIQFRIPTECIIDSIHDADSQVRASKMINEYIQDVLYPQGWEPTQDDRTWPQARAIINPETYAITWMSIVYLRASTPELAAFMAIQN